MSGRAGPRRRPGNSRRPSSRASGHGGFLSGPCLGARTLPVAFLCCFLWSLYQPTAAWSGGEKHPPDGATQTIVPPERRITDSEARRALADVEAMLGHAEKCRDLYARVLAEAGRPEHVLLQFADRMNTWGDFYQAEEIYRGHLRRSPQDDLVWLKLASLLRSCERYEEAEEIYRRLILESPKNEAALLGLARVKRLQWQLDEAGQYTERLLEIRQRDPEGLLLKAEIALLRNQREEAFEVYSRLRAHSSHLVPALLGMGKVRLEQGDPQEAGAFFEQARDLDPESVEARFYCAGPEKRETEAFMETLLEEQAEPPATLGKWAELYASQGSNKAAIRCYEASLEQDPDYFPSQIGLAEILAVDHQYEQALRAFEDSASTFSKNRKILIGRARTLAWAQRYEESLALYDRIQAISPSDPVPLREKARAAAWGKRMDEALGIYEQLLVPPVDQRLASAVALTAAESENEPLREEASILAEGAKKGSVYQGYEAFSKAFETLKADLHSRTRKRIAQELIRLLPAYNIQKGVSLEKQAKHLAWDLRFSRALQAYEELTRFDPGNLEALMDHARVQCVLGLCDREARTYRELLEMDPRHELARQALNRLEIQRSPSLTPRYSMWNESGRDRLSAMERHRLDLVLEVPVDCRFNMRVMGHHWIERPGYSRESFAADGFTLALDATLTPCIEGEVAWTRKDYRDEGLDTRDTGYARLWANLRDAAKVGVGYERTDELYNLFGLEQGIQADAWWLSISSHITRKLEVGGKARYLSYNDHNTGRHYLLEAGYALTDHPRLFKVAGFVEHRDTEEQNAYHYQGEELVNITHPYWTPADYYTGGIRFEWRHDLSEILLCRSKTHEYNLELTLATDTEHNPSVQLTGGWHWDFLDEWALEVQGLIHRSDLWDAEGLWANISYRF